MPLFARRGSKSADSNAIELEELEKLLTNGFEFLEQLCQETPPYTGESKTLARMLLDYFQCDPKKMLYVVLWAITREIECTTAEDVLFRESNLQTELMFGYFYSRRGLKYINFLVSPLITKICKSGLHFQLDDKNSPEYSQCVDISMHVLQDFITRFISIDNIPVEFLRVFRHMRKEMTRKYPSANQFIVLSLLFLRVICPAIIMPSITKVEVSTTPQLQRGLVACARVLQCVANDSKFDGGQDDPMCVFNDFISVNRGRIHNFFQQVTMENVDGGLGEDKNSKKNNQKDTALKSILQQLKQQCLQKIDTIARFAKATEESNDLLLLCQSPKWKLYRKRPDAETWTLRMRNNSVHASKIVGIVNAPLRRVYDFLHYYERSLAITPTFVRGKVVKVYDENHADILAYFRARFPFGIKEYYFSRYDYFLRDESLAVLVSFTIDRNDINSEDEAKPNEFNAMGFILQAVEGEPDKCNVIYMQHIDRKMHSMEYMPELDAVEYAILQNIRGALSLRSSS